MMSFDTEFEFVLPKGYIDKNGSVHKEGRMRLATASDEILPLKDPRVQSNPAYLIVILLSRVIVSMGTLESITPKIIEDLFACDLSYLQEFYNHINGEGSRVMNLTCPHCQKSFEFEPERSGE